MVPFRGRCSFRVYMKAKPCRYGMKMWAVADSLNSVLSNFDIYAGICVVFLGLGFFFNFWHIFVGKLDQKPEKNQGYRVVTQLISRYYNSDRRCTFDNFFTSIPLAKHLLDQGITSIGTLRTNKKEVPPEFIAKKNLEARTALYGFADEMMLVSWTERKNKTVLLLSTEKSSMPSKIERAENQKSKM